MLLEEILEHVLTLTLVIIIILILGDLTNFLLVKREKKLSFFNYIKDKKSRVALWIIGGGGVFISILWSFWYETLVPLIKTGGLYLFFFSAIGIILILGGIAIMFWGVATLLGNMMNVFNNQSFLDNIMIVQSKNIKPQIKNKPRIRNFLFLLKENRKAFMLLILGIVIFVIGALVGNKLGGF